MRILLVTHLYPPYGAGGVERVSEQTACGLTAAGHEVTVLTRNCVPVPSVPTLLRTSRRGVPVFVVEGGGGTHIGRFPHLAPRMEQLFEMALVETDPDVVLLSHMLNHSPMYVPIAHRWGVPVVVELHDYFVACERAHLDRPGGVLCDGPDSGRACATYCWPYSERAEERWALRTHIYRFALQHSDALTCPSEFVADFFRRQFGPLRPPLHILGNGVDLGTTLVISRRAPDPDRPLHLACVGAVTEHKGVHVVIDAVRKAGLAKIRLSLFGLVVPQYLEEIERRAQGLSEVLDLRVHGTFEPSDLPELLADVDALVIPSLVPETYSIAAHEALSLGVPVVASRIGALSEGIEHGRNGLLFEPGSSSDLAVLITRLDGDRELLSNLAEGISREDWIVGADRLARLEGLLVEVSQSFDGRTQAAEMTELVTMRDALPQL